MKTVRKLFPFLIMALFTAGCARMAVNAASTLIPDLTEAFFEECDLDLAARSLPAELKLMEGLLKSSPANRELLTALCAGFTGYSMLFVEDDDPKRASALYLRARMYGFRALGLKEGETPEKLSQRLSLMGSEEIRPLFWVTMSWNAWINLNLDSPEALAQLGRSRKCLERVMEIDPEFFYGSPYILKAAMLAARPKILGGDPVRARELFVKAMAVSNGEFFLAQFYYANYYAVRVQDRKLFTALIREVEETPANRLKGACLINSAFKKKMKRLGNEADELFF